MFDWLPHRRRIKELEDRVVDLQKMLLEVSGGREALLKENQQMRVLVTALRDVNASLDARCNDLERQASSPGGQAAD